jgi:hypothetical protein
MTLVEYVRKPELNLAQHRTSAPCAKPQRLRRIPEWLRAIARAPTYRAGIGEKWRTPKMFRGS